MAKTRRTVYVEEEFWREMKHLLPHLQDHKMVSEGESPNELLVRLAKKAWPAMKDELKQKPKIVNTRRR